MAEYETILLELDRDAGIATITLNRPDRANAISLQVGADLAAAMDVAEAEPAIRAVIVTGAGKYFCAGGDLQAKSDLPFAQMLRVGRASFKKIEGRLRESPLPVIAAINGPCLAGGCELALQCDIRIMAESARIGVPEVKFGEVPAAGGTQWLARTVGLSRAKELVLTGRALSAAEAERWGLVSQVVPDGMAVARAREVAAEIAGNAPYAIAAAKFLVNRSVEVTPDVGWELEGQITMTMATPEERRAARGKAAEREATYRRIFSPE